MLASVAFILASTIVDLHAKAAAVPILPLTATQPLGSLTLSPNVLNLKRKTSINGGANSRRSAANLLRRAIPVSGHSNSLTSVLFGQLYVTEVSFGTEVFELVVDTGSSDTWVIETGYNCLSVPAGTPVPAANCLFGPSYNVTKTFKQIPDENFNLTYYSGEFLTGVLGTEDVTVAGIKVEKQIVALVQNAAWLGDGTSSGLLGLAYPAFTHAYAGTVPSEDGPNPVEYSPIFKTMYTKGLTSPLFSVAILRDVSGPAGYLSFGGLPPVTISSDFVSTPILITNIPGYPHAYTFYTINIESVLLHRNPLPNSGGSAYQYIIDTGSTQNILPTSVADAINNAYIPPAVYDPDLGIYLVPCNAHAPSLGFMINGAKFDINPLDMLIDMGFKDANGNEMCETSALDGGPDPETDIYVLSDVFLKNVVAVFDVGAGMMRFASREHYVSNDPYKM